MQVILLKGGSACDVLRLSVDQLAGAFASLGYEPFVLDLAAEPHAGQALERAAADGPIALAFSFSIGGEFRDPRGRSLGQVVGAPHILHYVGYPLAGLSVLEATAPDTALLFVDESHADAVRSIYGSGRFAFLGFSPHGALGDAHAAEQGLAAFTDERPIPALFVGAIHRPIEQWSGLGDGLRAVFGAAVEIALSQDWIPALEALDQALAGFGRDPKDPQLAQFRKRAAYVDEFVRDHRRVRLLRAAGEVGLALHVYGRNHEPDLERFESLSFHGEVEVERALELMRLSRVVLNANANFGAGSDELTLSAMLAGAAAVTDQSRFYAAQFIEGRDLATYRWTMLEEGMSAVRQLSESPLAAHALAISGQRKVREGHLWSARAATMLAVAETLRGRRGRPLGFVERQ